MRALLFLSIAVLFTGCATVFSGYYTELEIRNAPDSLQVQTIDGVQLPTRPFSIQEARQDVAPGESLYETYFDKSRLLVQLRRGSDHVLILKSGQIEQRVAVYGKINPWVFGIDLLCGIVPAFFDALNGNWRYFSPIEFNKK